MADILTFIPPGTTFEPRQLAAISRAYEKACATLRVEHGPPMLKEALASEIISLARSGRCDPDRLCDVMLARIARGH